MYKTGMKLIIDSSSMVTKPQIKQEESIRMFSHLKGDLQKKKEEEKKL